MMGLWTTYFLAKLYLYFRGLIRFDVPLNFLFFLFIFLPLPKRFEDRRLVTLTRHGVAAIAAIMLLWHDSWLPDPLYAIQMLRQNGMPSQEYLYQFFLRAVSIRELAILAGLLIFSFFIRKHQKTVAAGTAVLLLLPLFFASGETGRRSAADLERYLGSFTNAESTLKINSLPPPAADPGFDILILQICSLAWDDLRELGMQNDPFFKQFDFLFTDFNSVTTYSNPAAIRLLNANCGQRRHADLYNDPPRECSLMDGLHRQGYTIRFARNHNGTYGKFDEETRKLGHLDATPFAPSNLNVKKFMFDNSPVYDDYDLLAQWWAKRMKSGDKKVALYYNTVSLHDGSHWTGDNEWWKRDNREDYTEFLKTLLADLSKFFDLLQSSGRNVAVVVMGEHGRALRGNSIEAPGIRDIPLPRITLVPVGLKLIGKNAKYGSAGCRVTISKPTSYFGLASVLESFAEKNPFSTDCFTSRAFIDSIPQTLFVGENENNLVVKYDDEFYFFGKDQKWIRLSGEALR